MEPASRHVYSNITLGCCLTSPASIFGKHCRTTSVGRAWLSALGPPLTGIPIITHSGNRLTPYFGGSYEAVLTPSVTQWRVIFPSPSKAIGLLFGCAAVLWEAAVRNRRRYLPALIAMAIAIPTAGIIAPAASAAVGPVGAGFTVTTGDLSFILKQIKIAERHSATLDSQHPCSTLLNTPGDGIPDAEQVPDTLTSYGLRTVDGTCNNLKVGDQNLSAADQPFPRLTTPVFKAAEGAPAGFFGPGSPAIPSSSYAQKKGFVFDSQPRTVSNLIDDQTSTNPAAVAAAAFPVRTQGNPGLHPCTTDPDISDPANPIAGVPVGCVPSHQTLFIPNVTTDVGLSPPYNTL